MAPCSHKKLNVIKTHVFPDIMLCMVIKGTTILAFIFWV